VIRLEYARILARCPSPSRQSVSAPHSAQLAWQINHQIPRIARTQIMPMRPRQRTSNHPATPSHQSSQVRTAYAATSKLPQTSDCPSMHGFSPSEAMGSGRIVAASSYCSVKLTSALGYDHYLPYTPTGPTGSTGWQRPDSIIQRGEWSARHRVITIPAYSLYSGNKLSFTYN
jgi:hypothetical protein